MEVHTHTSSSSTLRTTSKLATSPTPHVHTPIHTHNTHNSYNTHKTHFLDAREHDGRTRMTRARARSRSPFTAQNACTHVATRIMTHMATDLSRTLYRARTPHGTTHRSMLLFRSPAAAYTPHPVSRSGARVQARATQREAPLPMRQTSTRSISAPSRRTPSRQPPLAPHHVDPEPRRAAPLSCSTLGVHAHLPRSQ